MPIGIRKKSEEVTVYGLLHAGEKQFSYRMRFARIGLIESAKELKAGDTISVTGTFRVDNPKKSRLQELRVHSFVFVERDNETTHDIQNLQIEGEINLWVEIPSFLCIAPSTHVETRVRRNCNLASHVAFRLFYADYHYDPE